MTIAKFHDVTTNDDGAGTTDIHHGTAWVQPLQKQMNIPCGMFKGMFNVILQS